MEALSNTHKGTKSLIEEFYIFYMKELEVRTMENTKQEVKKGEVLQNGLKNRYKYWSDKKYTQTNCKMKTKQIKEPQDKAVNTKCSK